MTYFIERGQEVSNALISVLTLLMLETEYTSFGVNTMLSDAWLLKSPEHQQA